VISSGALYLVLANS